MGDFKFRVLHGGLRILRRQFDLCTFSFLYYVTSSRVMFEVRPVDLSCCFCCIVWCYAIFSILWCFI